MHSTERRGDWIQTASGRRFYPLDPRVDEIHLLDVAHALSNLCRFAGHTLRFYSVAEHSLHVSRRVEQLAMYKQPEGWLSLDNVRLLALAGLLHDTPEAYIVDVPRPLKHAPGMDAYRLAEDRIASAVCSRYELPPGAFDWPLVKHADHELLFTERRDLLAPMAEGDHEWGMGLNATALDDLDLRTGSGYAPGEAAALFVARFIRLRTEGGDLA